MAIAGSGHDFIQAQICTLGHPFWFATSENEWKEIFFRYIPRWLTVSNKDLLRGYYKGESTFYTAEHIKGWLEPVLWWTAFLSVLSFMMLCINVIIRKHLNADEIEKASSGTLLDKLSVKVSELEGLLLYFPFDDGKGNKAKDLSGNDFNGELNGPKWNSGKFGKALEFDGKDDFVGVEPLEVDPDEITIEFWFSPAEKLDSSDSRMDIVYALNGVSRPHITFNRANEINPGAIGFYPEFYSYHKNPSYRGEFFFLNSVNTASGIFRPNSIIVKVRVKEPDVLVINQNFHQDWHTDKGALQNHNGLLSLKLEKPGRYTIHLSYVPLDFYIGLLVTVISLISWCVILPP